MTYLEFPTPPWMLLTIAATLVFVVVRTGVHGALAFFLCTVYNSLIVRIGPTTLLPIALGTLVIAALLHLKHSESFRFSPQPIVAAYLALMGWVVIRGWIGLRAQPEDFKTLLFLVVFASVIPVVLANALSWDDNHVRSFAKGFVAAVVVQMVVVWSRALQAGVLWSSWVSDFWLTRWSSEELSPFVLTTGVTNYHWYSWNLGIAAIAVLFVLRTRAIDHRGIYLFTGGVFMVACVQQVAIVGSRQSIISLIVAVLFTAWTRVRKAVVNVGIFVVISIIVLIGLRVLADLEPLPVALMHGADTLAEAFDPTISRGREWQKGFEAFLRSPILGAGFGVDEGFSLGHNIVLNTLANFGVIGGLAFGLITWFYITGPLKAAYRQRDGVDVNRGIVGMQLFLVGTSLASGSLVASSGLFWLGTIIVHRSSRKTARTVPARTRYRNEPLPV